MAAQSARRVRWSQRVSRPRAGHHPLGSTDSIPGPQDRDTSKDFDLGPIGQTEQTTTKPKDHQETSEAIDKLEFPSGWKLFVIVLGLSLAVLCMALDNTILATAIPRITNQFNSLEDMGWYASAYMLAQCSMTLAYGKLYMFYVVKWVYLIALTLFEVGSLICGAAPNSLTLIIGRAIAGAGGAGLFVGSFIIISVITPLDKRPIYNAILSSIYGVAGVIGPLLGGAFTDYASWRWCFYINLPIGGLTALFVVLCFRAERPTRPPASFFQQFLELDIFGLIIFLPAIICLLLALQWGDAKYPWDSWRIITLLVVSAALILAFIAIEYGQQDRAIIPPRLIQSRNVWGSVIFSFCITGSFVVFTYYLPIWFQSVKGESATMSGVMNIPLILSVTITSMLVGWSVTTLGYYTPFMYAAPVVASVGAGLLSTLQVHSGHPAWIGFQALFGIGVGLGLGLPVIVIQAVLSPERVSSGTALITFMQSIAGALFNFAAQSVFQADLMHSLAKRAPSADASQILAAGASGFRDSVSLDILPAVLQAYNSAVTHAFYVGVALATASIIGVIPLRWISVKRKIIEPGAA